MFSMPAKQKGSSILYFILLIWFSDFNFIRAEKKLKMALNLVNLKIHRMYQIEIKKLCQNRKDISFFKID